MEKHAAIFLAPKFTPAPARQALGFYGHRPHTWGEWRSATFYTDQLIVSSK